MFLLYSLIECRTDTIEEGDIDSKCGLLDTM